MSWRDAVGLVWRELRRRAGRSALTVAAVALAATLLTALVTIAGTAQNRVLSEVSTGGPLAGIEVAAAQPDPSQVDQDNARPGPPKPLDDAALQRIRSLKDVAGVYPVVVVSTVVLAPAQVTFSGTTTHGPSEPYGDSLVGVPLDQSAHLPITLVAGRLPVPGSLTEVAATPDFLDRLQLSQRQAAAVIGIHVEIGFPRGFGRSASRAQWFDPTIVGVVAQDAGPGRLVGSIELAAIGRDWILAGGTQARRASGCSQRRTPGCSWSPTASTRSPPSRTRITAVGYSTQAPEQLIASVKRYLRVVEIVLSGVGLIALVVAALGIANALLAAVRERRREIGVLKAIGARDRDVMRIFLIEAVAVGTLGGLIGAALGTGIAAVVGLTVNQYLATQGVERLRLEVSSVVLVGAVLGSALLAGLAGLLPARRAARLPAREAVVTG